MKLPVVNPRFVVAVTLLMLLLSACRKDDSLEIAIPDLSNSMTVTPVSLADLENKPVFNALLSGTASKMDLYKPDDVLEKDGVDYTILTSRISKASFMDYEAYTFLVDNPQQPPFSFDNYIIRKHHDGTVAEFILRYVYDMTLWLGQGEKKFSSISRYDTEYNLETTNSLEATTDASKNTATALQNNCVVSITVYHQTPDDGIYEWQPGAVCQHTTEGDMCKITIEYTLDCIGGGGGEDNPGGDGPGGNEPGAGGWEILPDNGGMGSPISTMEPPLGPEEGAGDLFYLRQVIEAEVTPATTEEELLNKNNALAVYINQLNPFIFNELSLLFVSVNSDSELSTADRIFLWERARAMYDILKTKENTATDHISQEAFLNTLSPQEQEDFTTNLVTTALLPAVKGVLGIQWPQNTEEWMALFNLMKPMLIEIGIEFLPLGGLYNAIDDMADGLSEGDYTLAGIGLAGVVMEFIPWGKLIKIGKGLFNIGKKAFRIFKLAYNFLGQIGDAIATGLKTVLDGSTVRLVKNSGDEVAAITDNIMYVSKHGVKAADGSVVFRSADEVNAEFVAAGLDGPYKVGYEVTEFVTQESETFVRVFTEGVNAADGRWMVKYSDIEHIIGNPEAIQDYLALPNNLLPNKITTVNIPPGTRIRTGEAGPNFNHDGGVLQFEIPHPDLYPAEWFTNVTDL